MGAYYVKRKKYYFKIERERYKKKVILLTILVSAIVIFLLTVIRGLAGTSSLKKDSDDRAKKLALASQKKESNKEKRQPPANIPKIAIVIDDVGYIQTYIPQFQNMKIPLTFSIMPYSTHGKEDAELFHSLGHEIILHLPMENKPLRPSNKAGEVTTKMSDEQIIATLDNVISQIPYIEGINNHEGKVATADRRVMNVVLKYAKDRNLYFLDSFTTPNSVVCQIQGELGLPKRVNDLFIDNKENIEDIKAQLQKLGDLAKKKGIAIGIAHIQRPNTAQAIQEMVPVLKSQGIEFVFVSQIPNNR